MNKQNLVSSFIIILLVSGIAGGTIWLNQDQPETSQVNSSTTQSAQPTSSSSSDVSDSPSITSTESPTQAENSDGQYQDGKYQAVGRYASPGGTESIQVELTLDNDVVTQASINSQAENQSSKQYQQYFINGYKKFVVGKNIDQIKVTRVSGSSLTSMGFNQALATIKSQAKP